MLVRRMLGVLGVGPTPDANEVEIAGDGIRGVRYARSAA
jgi:hypothetical protein